MRDKQDKLMTSHASWYNKAIHGKRVKLFPMPHASNSVGFLVILF